MSGKGYDRLPSGASSSMREFQIQISPQKVQNLRELVKIAPLGPLTYESLQEDRKWGMTRRWLSEAQKYWVEKFDWSAQEEFLNSFPQFMASIKDDDGSEFDVHFMALFSTKSDAIPVALFHGWPGSFLEFTGFLTEMKRKYAAEDLPYHLIVPSLTGYTLSSGPPTDRNWTMDDTARLMNKLMLELGFGGGYIAQGGDIGSTIARMLAARYEACKAFHVNFQPAGPPKDGSGSDLTEKELQAVNRSQVWRDSASSYAREHATRPATIGFALSASPVAMLAWIGEKFLEWTDEDPSVEEVLRAVSLYWLTDTFSRCIYPYRDVFQPLTGELIPNKPMGFSWFPKEILPTPRSWIAATGNLVCFREHDQGGHFAAMERPKELAQDIEEFVAQVWPTVGQSRL